MIPVGPDGSVDSARGQDATLSAGSQDVYCVMPSRTEMSVAVSLGVRGGWFQLEAPEVLKLK